MSDAITSAKPGSPDTSAKSGAPADNSGIYAVAIAVLFGAILISASVYFGIGGLGDLMSKAPVGTLNANAITANSGAAGNTGSNSGANAATLPRTHGTDKTMSITVGGATFTRPYEGPANAKVTVVEFSDFQCPYCQRAYPTVEQVMKSYGGKVDLVYLEFPLPPSMHPQAEKAAEAAECAADQGAFWDYYDQSFTVQTLAVGDLKTRAAGLGLDTAKFNTCLDSGSKATDVAAQESAGGNVGVQGTPSFLIYASAMNPADQASLQTVANNLNTAYYGGSNQSVVMAVPGQGYGLFFSGALPADAFTQAISALNP